MQVPHVETNKVYTVFPKKEAMRARTRSELQGSSLPGRLGSNSFLAALGSRWTAGMDDARGKGTAFILWVSEEPQGDLGKGDRLSTAGELIRWRHGDWRGHGLHPREIRCTATGSSGCPRVWGSHVTQAGHEQLAGQSGTGMDTGDQRKDEETHKGHRVFNVSV